MEKRKNKNKIIKTVKISFTILSIVAVLFTSIINTYAYSSISYNDNDAYSGNTDIIISLNCYDSYYGYYFDISSSINPIFTYDMTIENPSITSSDYMILNDAQEVYSYTDFNSFECSDDYFTSSIITDNSWFASSFTQSYSIYYSMDPCTVNSIKITARDFYYYLDPNNELMDPYYEDLYAESFIYLDYKSMFEEAEGTIYYCLSGEEDTANNRKVYNYNLSNDAITSGIYMLPEESLSGTITEPTLIYIEYLELTILLDTSVNYELNEFAISGNYINYNMDYRNIDLNSYEEPITPIDPGIFADYTSWLGTAVSGFLDFQIVQGFTLGGIVMVLIAFMMCLWFLKVFAGG